MWGTGGGPLPLLPGDGEFQSRETPMKPLVSALLWPGCLLTIFSPSLPPSLTELQAHWPLAVLRTPVLVQTPGSLHLLFPPSGSLSPRLPRGPSLASFRSLLRYSLLRGASLIRPPHSRFIFLPVLVTD